MQDTNEVTKIATPRTARLAMTYFFLFTQTLFCPYALVPRPFTGHWSLATGHFL
jgi:hypothetical protein